MLPSLPMAPLLMEKLLRPGAAARRAEALAAEAPLVIMGRGKSGTRLLAWACQLLGFALGATDRHKTGDLDDRRFLAAVKTIARRSLVHAPDAPPNSRDLVWFQREAHRVGGVLRAQPGAEAGWGWKWPETYLIAPYVHATFPRARFIHMVRDGRDLAFKRHLTDDPRRKLGRALLTCAGAMDDPRHLQAARSWQFQVERYRAYGSQIPEANRLDITYEALCRNPEGEMARVAKFLRVEFTEPCRDYVRDHFNQDLIEAWRREDAAQVREVEAAIGETLLKCGYALSDTR